MSPADASASSGRRLWPAVAVTAGLFIVLAVATWHRSGHLLVDYGRELYLPWRLAHGAVLYRDVDSLMGPLAPYVNAAVFRVAGASVTTLLAFDLVIMAALVGLLALYFRALVPTWTLVGILVVFQLLFGFAMPLGVGNGNYLTPYSHAATFGMLAAVGTMVAVTRYAARRDARWAVLAGLGLGLCFLTKPEIMAAAGAGCVVVLGLSALRNAQGTGRGLAVSSLAGFVAGALAAPCIAFVSFRTVMPGSEALEAATGAWRSLAGVQPLDSDFYRWVAGFDDPSMRMAAVLKNAAGVIALLLVAAWAGRVVDPLVGTSSRRRSALGVGLLAVAAATFPFVDWGLVPRGFPVLVGLLGLYYAYRAWTETESEGRDRVWLPLVGWTAFSAVLLLKMILKTRIGHYGFVLAMPATLLLVASLVQIIPEEVRRRTGSAHLLRGASIAFTCAFVAHFTLASIENYAGRTHLVGSGPNRMYYEASTARLMDEVLDQVGEDVKPGDALVVLPEGAGINFLTGTVNPTPHISVIPPELAAFGEQAVLADLRAAAPSFVLVWSASLYTFGFGRFGEDRTYAPRIIGWIEAEYEPMGEVEPQRVAADPQGPGFVLYGLRREAGWQAGG